MNIKWTPIEGSTLVTAAAFDRAARRVHVRFRSGEIRTYEQCDESVWREFMSPHISKGEYVTRILSRRERDTSDSAGATILTDSVLRGLALNAFRPAQEMYEPQLFAGRHRQVKAIADALRIAGSCPLIYGDRGLGKSSLAAQGQLIAMGDTQLLDNLNAGAFCIPPNEAYLTLFVTCSDAVRDLDELLQLIINAAEAVVGQKAQNRKAVELVDRTTRRKLALKVFEAETTKTFEVEKRRLSFEQLSLSERVERLTHALSDTYQMRVLIIIDELDRLRDKAGLGSLVKMASSASLKFLLVGIAQDWSDLILDHSSVERQIVPVHVPRMTPAELAEIIERAVTGLKSSRLDLHFSDRARERIVDVAAGFPWFVHVVAQAALMSAVDDGEASVTSDRVTTAVRELVTNRFAQQFADGYQRAVRDSINRELTLRVLASWPTANVPTSDVYPVLRRLGVTNPAVYRGHLAREKYGQVILSPSYQERGLVRFRNEMFKRYVYLVPSLYEGVDGQVTKATKHF